MTPGRPMKIIVLCPHFAPDAAATGVVMTRIVDELVALGNTVHVVTALPWYRQHKIEQGWADRWVKTESTSWGSITRVTPFPGDDKSNLVRRAVGFLGFSALAGVVGLGAGGWFSRADAVLAVSPPLTMGITGRLIAFAHRARLVFNIQDVFPDALVSSGSVDVRRRSIRLLVGAARVLERWSYRMSDKVTVLSDDLASNVAHKVGRHHAGKVVVIPNFAQTDVISPTDRDTDYRRELGIGDGLVVLYAGNVGFSQSLDLVVEAARRRPEIDFVINGGGSARPEVDRAAAELGNLHVRDYQPEERLSEVLATGDIHVVPLKTGLGDVSVPSKSYSSLAAGRPVIAAIDPDTAVPRLLEEAEAGISVRPDDIEQFLAAIDELAGDPARREALGANGRRWVEDNASPRAVGAAYDGLMRSLR